MTLVEIDGSALHGSRGLPSRMRHQPAERSRPSRVSIACGVGEARGHSTSESGFARLTAQPRWRDWTCAIEVSYAEVAFSVSKSVDSLRDGWERRQPVLGGVGVGLVGRLSCWPQYEIGLFGQFGAHARIRTGDLYLTKWSSDPGELNLILALRATFGGDRLPSDHCIRRAITVDAPQTRLLPPRLGHTQR
jgi:hypothetical protein